MRFDNGQFFYCYDKGLFQLFKENNIKYITTAKHLRTDQQFWMYFRTPEVNEIVSKWMVEKSPL
jgi:hypothetical protein